MYSDDLWQGCMVRNDGSSQLLQDILLNSTSSSYVKHMGVAEVFVLRGVHGLDAAGGQAQEIVLTFQEM